MNQINKANDKQSARNISYIWVNRLFLILTPIITTPMITNFFGLETAGIWFLASIFASQLFLLEVGISTSLVRLLANSNIINDRKETIKIITTSFLSLFLISSLLILLIPAITIFFLSAFEISSELQADAKKLITIAIASVVINLPLRIGYSILASRHLFDKVQIIDTVGIAFRLFSIVIIFTFFSPSIFELGLIVFGVSIAVSFITFVKAKKQINLRLGDLSFSNFSFKSWKLVISLSSAAFFVSLGGILLLQFSSTLIGYNLEIKYVSIMAIPILIFNSITPFFQAIPTISSPIAAGVSNKKEKNDIKMQFHLYTSYTISLALLGVIGLLTAGKPLLIIWLEGDAVSSEDIFLMLDILIIIFTSYALGSIAPLGRSILMSTGYHWKVAFVEFLSSVLGILSGLYFMLALDFGVLGMAGGIGLTLLLRGFIFYPIMLSSYFETRLIYLIGESINKSATIFIALFLLMMLFDRIEVFSHFNILFELLQFILICIIWAVLNTIFILSNQHKKYLYSFLSKFN